MAAGAGTYGCIALAEHELKANYNTDDIEPVSYTHLRAHETVLDLVCRLLLEKKTTNTMTEIYV